MGRVWGRWCVLQAVVVVLKMGQAGVALAVRLEVVAGRSARRTSGGPRSRRAASRWRRRLLLPWVAVADGETMGHAWGRLAVRLAVAVAMKMD